MSTTEFDEYASDYERLLQNPLRDRFAGGSEFFARRKWELLRQFLSDKAIDAGRQSWLDVGCGTGTMLRMASDAFAEARGCDPSREMLRACDDLQVELQMDALRLPFEDQSFDLVTLVCVLHHVVPADRPELMTEVARVLRPGGFAGIFEHNPYNPVTRRIVRQTPVDRDAVLLTANASRRLMEDAGLRNASTQFFLYLPERAYQRLGFCERFAAWLPLGGQYAVFGRLALDSASAADLHLN